LQFHCAILSVKKSVTLTRASPFQAEAAKAQVEGENKRLSRKLDKAEAKSGKLSAEVIALKEAQAVEIRTLLGAHAKAMDKAQSGSLKQREQSTKDNAKELEKLEKKHKKAVMKLQKNLAKEKQKTKTAKKKAAKAAKKKRLAAAEAQQRRWGIYHGVYAQAEAAVTAKFEAELTKLEQACTTAEREVATAAASTKAKCEAEVAKLAEALGIAKKAQKDQAAQLRYYQNKELEEEDRLEEETGCRKTEDEDYDDIVLEVGDFTFRDEGKTNKWSYDLRLRIMKLLIIGLSPSQIGPTMQVFSSTPIIVPSDRFMREIRSEMRIVTEALAARAAADPDVID
jgi:hypothetical protein